MKKESLIIALKCAVFGLIVILISGCQTAPDDIWSMLRSGDDRAADYFVGEYDVNIKDENGKTPLHYAAERKDANLARFFLANGAKPDVLDNSNQSPLLIAALNNDYAVAQALVTGGADIHFPVNHHGYRTSAAAIALDTPNFDIKSILTPASVESSDENDRTILHLASISGNVRAVYEILSYPSTLAHVNKKDNENKNPLDYAFERTDSRNHMEIAEQLILSGGQSDSPVYRFLAPASRSANYNIRNNEGLAPLHFAIIQNHRGLIYFLLEKNLDINIKSTSGSTALHEAVRTGNVEIINFLIAKGADVNAADAQGNTPLHMGMPSNVHLEIVTILLDSGANPNQRDEYGETPLHIAVILNSFENILQALLGGGSDVHVRNIEGKTPFYLAVQEKRENLIHILLSYGSEVFAADNTGVTPFDLAARDAGGDIFNMIITEETANQRDSAGNTLLHAAVMNRVNPEKIALILDKRALVDARNRAGDTALHIAVRMNQRQAGEFLLSRGANIFSINASGESPLYLSLSSTEGIREWMINPSTIIAKDGLGNNMLHYASQWNLNNAIPVILRKGLSIESQNATGETPVFMAVKNDSPSTIKIFADNRADLNARDSQGNSVLHAAVRWNAVNSVSYLITNGMDVNMHTLNGNTPLHDAVTLGMADIEELLIKNGADLEARNIDGNTPFMEAVRAGMVPSMRRLVANGADPSARNTRGDTPLHMAVSTESLSSVNMLLGMGASIHARNTRNITPYQIALSVSTAMVSALLTNGRINASDDMGNTVLHIAIQERVSSDLLRTILSRGARINAIDRNGKTPLRLAVDLNQWESAKILADSGADPFIAAVDNKTAAEISFGKGEEGIRSLFSGRAINSRDSSQNTILHIAARYGNPGAILILLDLGANKTIRNISSEAPYDIALRWNRLDNADVLKL
jgi:ankyrin repeat protein